MSARDGWRKEMVGIAIGLSREWVERRKRVEGYVHADIKGLAVTPAHRGNGYRVTHLVTGFALSFYGHPLPVYPTLDEAKEAVLALGALGDWTRTRDEMIADRDFIAAARQRLVPA